MTGYSKATTILGPTRGDGSEVAAWLVRRGAKRTEFALEWCATVYRICAAWGVRAEVVIAQTLVEAGDEQGTPLSGEWWIKRGNSGNLGVTGDPAQNERSPVFATGRESAIAHVVHLLLYAVGPDRMPSDSGDFRELDPRWDAAVAAGIAGRCPTIGSLTGVWATDPQYDVKILSRLRDLEAARLLGSGSVVDGGSTSVAGPVAAVPSAVVAQAVTPVSVTGSNDAGPVVFGRVPMYGYDDLVAEFAGKPEGVGWDNLGLRDVLFVCLHRMWGSLQGTREFFALRTTQALTDFGVGVEAQDGAALAGVIQRYNDPEGYRSGWASGRISAPYGDGLALITKYGPQVVNRRGVSLEVSGFEDTAIDAKAWGEIVLFIARWADQKRIPWFDFPIYHVTGCSFVVWHEEFTVGTGKRCPFQLLKSRTGELIADVRALLRKWQAIEVSGVVLPSPAPSVPVGGLTPVVVAIPDAVGSPVIVPSPAVEVPVAKYADVVPVAGLLLIGDYDARGIAAYSDANGTRFRLVNDRVRVTEAVAPLAWAPGGPASGPVLPVGAEVEVSHIFTAADGQEYYLRSPDQSRIPVDATTLIGDARAVG